MDHLDPKDFPEGLCPFQSTPGHPVPCGSICQMHRDKKGRFGCALHDLAIIAWNLKPENQHQQR